MERDWVRLIGGGVQVLAEALDGGSVPRCALRGYALLEHLTRTSGIDLGPLVVGTVLGLWTDWRGAGPPQRLGTEALASLTRVLDAHRPSRSTLALALSAFGGGTRVAEPEPHQPAGPLLPSLLAAEVVERAETSGALARADLNARIVFFLVERMFAHLLVEARTIRDLEAAIAGYLGKSENEAMSRRAPPRARSGVETLRLGVLA
jgi:hypothetical protein